MYDLNGNRIIDEEFKLFFSNRGPTAITTSSNRIFVVDYLDLHVYVYIYNGIRVSDEEFDLNVNNRNPASITTYNNLILIGDSVQDKVFAYRLDGSTVVDKQIDTSNESLNGLVSFEGKLYILDNTNKYVYVHSLLDANYGERITSLEFSVSSLTHLSGLAKIIICCYRCGISIIHIKICLLYTSPSPRD